MFWIHATPTRLHHSNTQLTQHHGQKVDLHWNPKRNVWLTASGLPYKKLLIKWLAAHDFYPHQFTLGLWKYVWQPITFVLMVYVFVIKCNSLQHAKYLLKTLHEYYDFSIDWSGTLCCGITFKRDIKNALSTLWYQTTLQKRSKNSSTWHWHACSTCHINTCQFNMEYKWHN